MWPVLLKLVFDGAMMTSGKQIQQEVGGFQILSPGEELSLVKLPKNCHVYVLYIGSETEEELSEALTHTNEVISVPPSFVMYNSCTDCDNWLHTGRTDDQCILWWREDQGGQWP